LSKDYYVFGYNYRCAAMALYQVLIQSHLQTRIVLLCFDVLAGEVLVRHGSIKVYPRSKNSLGTSPLMGISSSTVSQRGKKNHVNARRCTSPVSLRRDWGPNTTGADAKRENCRIKCFNETRVKVHRIKI